MCGIVGLWSRDPVPQEALARWIGPMRDSLTHRGPDSFGDWFDPAAGLVLGHRRLAIVDLSAEGHQPMVSPCGRFILSYNGEVFNAPELRAELGPLGYSFRGHSDTEILLASVAAFGVEGAVRRLNGQFAFAVWDREERRVSLVRDRLGIKPLFYASVGGRLIFGSQLSALRAFEAFDPSVDRDSLVSFLRFGAMPDPFTIYEGVRSLPPGHIAHFDTPDGPPSFDRFWSALEVATQHGGVFSGAPVEAVEALHTLLADSVARRMMADVPLGAFLSGGVDSSTIVALMQSQSSRRIRTFSIGYADPAYDEGADARRVARHLGTEHTELVLEPARAIDLVPRLASIWDQPFADTSQLPTRIVSELAREHVTVSLSGDGGDELFGGYNRHLWAPRLWSRLGRVPQPARRMAARILRTASPSTYDRMFRHLPVPPMYRMRMVGDKVHKLAGILPSGSLEATYRALRSQWQNPGRLVVNGVERPSGLPDVRGLGPVETMMLLDLVSYLPEDILTKVDRASMSVSLEGRVPLLDHRVVELAWSFPLDVKIRDGQGKWVLRQVLERYVPRDLYDRPKMGFGVPLDAWLRGPLRGWAEELLAEGRLAREGYLHPEPIVAAWNAHTSGRRNLASKLWPVLMFQAWLENQNSSRSPT